MVPPPRRRAYPHRASLLESVVTREPVGLCSVCSVRWQRSRVNEFEPCDRCSELQAEFDAEMRESSRYFDILRGMSPSPRLSDAIDKAEGTS